MEWVQRVLDGDRLAVSRAISAIERQDTRDRTAHDLLALLYPHTGRAHLVGLTGAPGTGKSSLASSITRLLRERGKRVGIVAVDPTSPRSGGALLGDRIRMRDVATDPGVFVRSMATRGMVGGLSRAASGAVHVLDAAGYEVILIETVGAGQDEVAISQLAHTVVLVQAPGLGDDIQAIKAGLGEVADIYTVNKMDREGAEQAVRALELMIEMGAERRNAASWQIPVCQTIALDGTGVSELVAQIEAHRQHLIRSGELVEREVQRARNEIELAIRELLFSQAMEQLRPKVDELAVRLARRELDPSQALCELFE